MRPKRLLLSKRTRLSIWATICAFGLIAFPAVAQNPVPNPDFDTGTLGWSANGTMLFWTPEDHEGSASSGSATLQVFFPGAELLSSCFAIGSGQRYRAEVWHRTQAIAPIAADSGRTGSKSGGGTFTSVELFSDGACNTEVASPGPFLPQAPDSVWKLDVFPVLTPANAASARISLHYSPAIFSIGSFDGISLTEAGTEALFDDGFESGDTLTWTSTVIGS